MDEKMLLENSSESSIYKKGNIKSSFDAKMELLTSVNNGNIDLGLRVYLLKDCLNDIFGDIQPIFQNKDMSKDCYFSSNLPAVEGIDVEKYVNSALDHLCPEHKLLANDERFENIPDELDCNEDKIQAKIDMINNFVDFVNEQYFRLDEVSDLFNLE